MQENVSLKNKNTFKIGGKAKYYTEVSSKEELKKVLALNLPFFVLGEGSNVLVSDNGFNGIVIKLNFKDILIKDNTIQVGAGLLLRDLVLKAKELNLGGIEWAIGIPGTIGGALFGNAGIPNFTIGNMVKQVKVLEKNKVKTFKKQDCLFNYRDSIFKKNKDLIILSALLEFKGHFNKELAKEFFKKRNSIKGYSIGSIFKNGENYYAGKLIDDCGLKGKQVGDAIISYENANWIINLGNASSKDIEDLILIAKTKVKEKFNIDLVEEIRRLG